MQCKDIPEEQIVRAIQHMYDAHGYVAMRHIQGFFDDVPPKVIQAKLRTMELRYSWLEGCACGCGTAWYIDYRIASQDLQGL